MQKTTHNAAAPLGVKQVSDWIARMELTDPEPRSLGFRGLQQGFRV